MPEWTKTPPATPGWYWRSVNVWRKDQGPCAVLVEHECAALVGWVPLMDYTEPVADQSEWMWPGQWFGPIQPPPGSLENLDVPHPA